MPYLLVKNVAYLLDGGHFFKADESGWPEVTPVPRVTIGRCLMTSVAQDGGRVQGWKLQTKSALQ